MSGIDISGQESKTLRGISANPSTTPLRSVTTLTKPVQSFLARDSGCTGPLETLRRLLAVRKSVSRCSGRQERDQRARRAGSPTRGQLSFREPCTPKTRFPRTHPLKLFGKSNGLTLGSQEALKRGEKHPIWPLFATTNTRSRPLQLVSPNSFSRQFKNKPRGGPELKKKDSDPTCWWLLTTSLCRI
jgi:hypothetical protein